MDIFTTLAATIIFISLLLHVIRVLTVGNSYRPDEEAAEFPPIPNGSGSTAEDENDDEGFRYDVFLSFRGEDTRKGFVGHLYKALKRREINAFMDNRGLGKGEPIDKLLKAIRQSKIVLPIFSKRYAESIWCMREIAETVDVREKGRGQVVIIPIFFDVEPEDVWRWYRTSQGQFGSDASADDKKKWRRALREVKRIHGFTLSNNANGDEAELVDLIVGEVEAKLNKIPLHVPEGVKGGLVWRVQEVRSLVKNEETDVNMIGIQGMHGIGKTTIAEAVYNELFHNFDGASFISDVGDKFGKGEGVKCQEQLICDITSTEDRYRSSICSIHAGINKVKEKTTCRKVLIVLDDVDRIEQLQALAGGRDWFATGSVIIITSNDEKVLLQHGVKRNQIYKPELLSEEEALHILKPQIFKGREPTRKELQMSREIVETAGRLPLAVQVLGRHFASTDTVEWRDELEKLKDIPVEEVEERLRISYDGLSDVEKEIFLDISCFFVGADYGSAVNYYWKACGFHSKPTIKVLESKSLVTLDRENRFHMHVLLRKMGREIARRRSDAEPRRDMDRLWTSDSIFDLLQRDEVPSSQVKGIMLNKGVEEGKELCSGIDCFRNMHHLRLLHMEGVNFKNNFRRFPKELLWLGLPRCSFESPPSDLNLQKLVVLNLSNCNLASLSFFGDMVFKGLKILDLSSTDLTETPNFNGFPDLVELSFRQCEKLAKIHPSIGNLKRLVTLDMRTCTLLEELPDTICLLESIQILLLGWCKKLSSLPEEIGNLTSLKELSLNDTGIKKIPCSVGQLTSLTELSLQRCNWLEPLPDSLDDWFALGKLKMFGTPQKITEEGIDLSKRQPVLRVSSCKVLSVLPDESCKAVKEFRLTDPAVQELPHSIKRLQNLVTLSLKCEQVGALPMWINGKQLEKIRELEIQSKSLETLPESIGSLEGLKTLKLVCENLQSLPDSVEKLKDLEIFEVASGNLERLPSIGSIRSLRQFKVKCPNIKAIPKSIKQLEELEILELHLDNPKALPDSTTLPKKLKELALRCNDLEKLPDCVWSLGELEKLSLSGCRKIEALPDDKLAQMKSLLHLDLSQTIIKNIPESVRFLPRLRSLQIGDDAENRTTFFFE
ncbi:unnamed protein product [Victoria cruziana]